MDQIMDVFLKLLPQAINWILGGGVIFLVIIIYIAKCFEVGGFFPDQQPEQEDECPCNCCVLRRAKANAKRNMERIAQVPNEQGDIGIAWVPIPQKYTPGKHKILFYLYGGIPTHCVGKESFKSDRKKIEEKEKNNLTEEVRQEIIQALSHIGYEEKTINALIDQAIKNNPNIKTSEALIKEIFSSQNK